MRKVLAVSGGVDSMVMLDMMMRRFPAEELVVATFDHGARESSKADADFVAEKVSKKVKIYRGEAQLGTKTSEEKAREKRYDFLRKVAFEERAEIYTAHHLDDLVESVAINVIRGTGWRGVAVLNAPGVRRPLVDGALGEVFDKRKILQYAASHEIEFRQDPTNTSDDFLRNRVRPNVMAMSFNEKMRLYELWKKQKATMREVDEIIEAIIPEDLVFQREWFRGIDDGVAMEILRAGLLHAGVSATRPQIHEFLDAILNYLPGKKFNLPDDKLVMMHKHDFMLEV